MLGKFNPYDLKAFLQAVITFVFLFGLLVADGGCSGVLS
jgi:hypothetical protein